MKNVIKVLLVVFLLLFVTVCPSFAQAPKNVPTQAQYKGVIIQQVTKDYNDNGKLQSITYRVKLDSGKTVLASYPIQELQSLKIDEGAQVILTQVPTKTSYGYQIVDLYRLPALFYFLIVFVILAVVIVGRKGIGSLLGLVLSLLIILYGIVPAILKGIDPLLATVVGSIVILFVTTYLAHGISKKTSIAVVSTAISLVLTLGIAAVCIEALSLSGYGSENVYDLYFATGTLINAKGLLLSGIIIGTLGALNDVTVTQSSTIFEMKKLDHTLSFGKLFKKGIAIGQDHGASMVNTIVLAYAGSSLFLFIFFIVNPQKQPLWAILNNEFMVEEIVIALGGTMGILLSVPIVTALASFIVANKKPS